MAISEINPFIHPTTAYSSYNNSQIKGYHQASAQVTTSKFPTNTLTEEDYRRAIEISNALKECSNKEEMIKALKKIARKHFNSQGRLYADFEAPEKNGTGQLRPKDDNETKRTLYYA